MQIKIQPKIYNTYTLRLIDDNTKEIKQEIKTHNVILNNFWKTLFQGEIMYIFSIAFGNGEGTPQATDTGVFSRLWESPRQLYCTELRQENNTIIYHCTVTIPATSGYVGNITEIALMGSRYAQSATSAITHAMLKDAEGNNISINKTDLDKLEVEVEIRISAYTDNISGFEMPAECDGLISLGFINNAVWCQLVGKPTDIYAVLSYYKNKSAKSFQLTGGTYSYDTALRKAIATKYRLGVDKFNGHYLNCIQVNGIGHFKLPNSNIMPNVTVQGVPIGVGDGNTMEFEPPIDLFIKDTDKVYIDGVLKVRDIDYTIDNKSNRRLLHEITPGNFMKNFTGGLLKSSVSTRSYMPFMPIYGINSFEECYKNPQDINYIDYCFTVLDGNNPIIMELDEDPTIGLDINGCMLRYFYIRGASGTSSFTNVDIVLEYSTDGNTFTEIARADLTEHSYSKVYDMPFDTVNAKYWKLSLDFSRASESEQTKKDSHYITFHDEGGSSDIKMSMLYYKGEPIKFTTPPAEGAVITMDCTLDRPYKTENWVVDFGYEIQV